MAQNAASIITAALDDSQLRRSIDNLITAVNSGTATMASSFDTAIEKMTSSLAKLNSAGSQSNNASNSRTQQNQRETESVNALASSYDKLRAASDAMRGRANLRYNSDDELLNLRTQETWLKSRLRRHEGGGLYSPITDTDIQQARTLTNQIEQLRQRIIDTQADMRRGLIPQDTGQRKIEQLNSYIDNVKTKLNAITGGKSVENIELWRNELAQVQAQIQAIGQRMQFVHDQEQKAIRDAEAQRRASEQARQQAKQVPGAMTMGESNEQQILAKLQAIKRLRDQLQDSGILSQSRVNQMNNAIDRLEKKLAKINAQIAKIRQKRDPLNTSGVLGMSESTIDNIAAKMRAISELRGRLSIARQSGEIKVLNQEYKRLAETQNMLLNRNNRLITANRLLGNSFNYIRNRVIYALSIGALTNFVRQLIEVRGQYELLERGIGVLVNSFTKGSEIFNQLSSMALKSPFTLIELAGAAKQLSAYNFKAGEIVDTTRRLADISAALGVPMERLVYNLGQIRAQTVLTARDARDFANAGLPIINTLAQYYSKLEGRVVSTGDVYDRMSKKMVSYSDVMSVINEITDEGGKFFDYQAKTADTLRVQVANLTLAWNNMLNEIGESNQSTMSGFLGLAKSAFLHWRGISQVISDVVVAFGVLKGAMLTYAMFINSGTRALTTNLAAEKASIVAKLQKKKALVGLSKAEKAQLMAAKKTTAADYKAALASETYRKSQLKALIARNQNNMALITAIRETELLTEKEIQASMNAGRMGRAWMQFKASIGGIRNVLSSVFSPQNLIMGGVMLGTQAYQVHQQNLEDLKNFRQSIIDSSKESGESISKFLSDYRDSIQRVTQGAASEKEAVDLWVAVKEQIENSTNAAKIYIDILSGVEDYSQRVAMGVNMMKDAAEAARLMGHYANSIEFTQGFDFFEAIKKAYTTDFGDTLKTQIPVFGAGYSAWQLSTYNWEGLNDDAKDYNDRLREIQKVTQDYNISLEYTVSIMDKLNSASERQQALMEAGYSEDLAEKLADAYSGTTLESSLKTQREEVLREIDETIAMFIPKLNSMGNLTRNQLFEILLRYENAIVEANENIEGETRNMFHRALVESLPEQYGEYKQELLAYTEPMHQFFEYVYSRNKESFENVTKDQIEQIDWTTGKYKEMIDDALRQIEKITVPETFNAIAKMVDDANSLRIVIPILLNVVESRQGALDTDLQREYDAIMRNVAPQGMPDWYKFTPAAYRPKPDEQALTFSKRIHGELSNVTKVYEEQKRNLSEIATTMGKDSAAYKSALEEYYSTVNQFSTLTGIASIYKYSEEEKKKSGGRRGGGRGAKPEDEVAKAIKSAIQVMHEIRSNYEKLSKAGGKDKEAIEIAASGYEQTIQTINDVLTKFGVTEFDASKFAGKDITDVKKMLEDMLKSLVASGKVKLESLKDLNFEIGKVTIDAKELDILKVADSINNELTELKNEYDIAMDIEANPELGEMFNEMMGIDASDFPKTIKDVVERAQKIVNDKLTEKGFGDFDIMRDNLEKWASGQGVLKGSNLYTELSNVQKYAQDLFKKRLKETEKALDDYVKKYGQYADKIAEIEANRLKKIKDLNDVYWTDEMRNLPEYIARLNAINRGAQREEANAAFEHFKEDGLYTQLFEDLDHLSDASLQILRQRINEIRDTFQDLKPDQLKTLNEQLEKLDKQAIKRNPFSSFGRDLKTYVVNVRKWKQDEKELLDLQARIEERQSTLNALMKERERMKSEGDTASGQYEENEAQIKHYMRILELEEKQAKALEKELEMRQKIAVSLSTETQAMIQIVNDYVGSMAELRDITKEAFGIDVPEIDGFLDGMQRASKGVASAAQSAMSGNPMGVLGGVGNFVYGVFDGIASIFGGGSAKNKKIDKKIEASTRTVKRLENAYKDLERAVERSLGTSETLARRAAIENKKQQLAETERQLALEKSRDKKYRDEDKIIELEGQVKDLRNEINDAVADIANTLLGSDIKSAAEGFVSTFLSAWKQGENTLDALKESFEDTIETMITKSLASALVAARLRKIYDMVEEFTREKSDGGVGLSFGEIRALRNTMQEGGGIVEGINQDLTNLFNALGYTRYGGGTSGLSALQQGIQGMTEDQAGALEAYWNASVQQSYLHSALLTEIRDMLTMGDFELNAATQAQMLLQLQQSYQVQMAISELLLGWSNPSGNAVRVQMI